VLADRRTPALLALVALSAVWADATPATLLALAPLPVVFTYASPTAIFALAALALMYADAAPSAFLALAPLPVVLANAAAAAFLALCPLALVRADAAPTAVLALALLLAMLAGTPSCAPAAGHGPVRTNRRLGDHPQAVCALPLLPPMDTHDLHRRSRHQFATSSSTGDWYGESGERDLHRGARGGLLCHHRRLNEGEVCRHGPRSSSGIHC